MTRDQDALLEVLGEYILLLQDHLDDTLFVFSRPPEKLYLAVEGLQQLLDRVKSARETAGYNAATNAVTNSVQRRSETPVELATCLHCESVTINPKSSICSYCNEEVEPITKVVQPGTCITLTPGARFRLTIKEA